MGAALGAATKDSPNLLSSLPSWFSDTRWGYAPLVLFLIGATLIGIRSLIPAAPNDLANAGMTDTAHLFLQFSDQHTVPVEKAQTNILSWYALYTESIYVNFQNEKQEQVGSAAVPPRWTVFLLFEKRMHYRQMIASCKGNGQQLKCDVAASTDRFAIITVVGDVTNATVELTNTK